MELVARSLISHDIITHLAGLGLARAAEIILLLVIAKVRQQDIFAIRPARFNFNTGLKRGLIWSFSFGAVAGIGLLIVHLGGFKISGLFRLQLPAEGSQLVLFFLVGVLIGPIAEEIFFRGILYGFFRRWGIPTAIVLSTLLFVLPHTSGSIIPVTQLIGGILFAFAYEVEKNLLVPMIIHCLGNLAIFTLALLF
ncbi:MAG: type II CAAX endopeptidase family protein [Desulfobacterales bacterium]